MLISKSHGVALKHKQQCREGVGGWGGGGWGGVGVGCGIACHSEGQTNVVLACLWGMQGVIQAYS